MTPADVLPQSLRDVYLRRIQGSGPLEVDLSTLRRLHVAHLRSVPFENLSIHAGEPIALDLRSLFEKIVLRRRGGFCYELNGLFAALLRSIGFDVAMLSAGVMDKKGSFGPDFDHMLLAVALRQGTWLADVGFGDSFVEPLQLGVGAGQLQGSGLFRVDSAGNSLVVVRQDEDMAWQPQYRFDLTPHELSEYAGMCRYHQTSPDSPFTQKRVCSIATADGRITLSDRRLIVTTPAGRLERELEDEAEYLEALQQHFGVAGRTGWLGDDVAD